MDREKRDSPTELNAVSRAIRETILDAAEDDLDEAIKSEGVNPETLAEKGRITIEIALAKYWAQKEEAYKETDRQCRGNAWRRDL